MSLQPHQERVVEEKSENDSKVNSLTKFIFNDKFLALDDAEQDRMIYQLGLMHKFSHVLGSRIEAFHEE